MGQARLDQINHKMHYVMTGERNTGYEAWVKEREVEGAKKGQKKGARRSSGFAKPMKSKAAKRAEKESKKAKREARELEEEDAETMIAKKNL